MYPPLLAASVAVFSLSCLVHAIPQQNQQDNGNGYDYGHQTYSTTTTATTATISTASTALVADAAVSTSTSTSTSMSTTACNNSPLLCDRAYNNITHMGAHDVAFLRDSSTSFSVSGNQFYNATTALSAGIRLLQAQVHNSNGTLELCHTSCLLLDGGSLETWLSEIKTWMDANTNEVATILLVNSDDEDVATFGDAFTSSGISTYGYTPTTTSGPISTWPTLQNLITANTRLVTFIASITYSATYPYLLSEFDFVFETTFGVTSMEGFNCTLQRPTTLSSSTSAISAGYMGLLNHFSDTAEAFGITVPDITDIATTNSARTNTTGALGTHGAQCENEWGSLPTFILVDFWNVGPAIYTADNLNGITATGRTSVSTSELTAGSSIAGATSASGIIRVASCAMAVVAFGNSVWL